jgi:hypothetical protein
MDTHSFDAFTRRATLLTMGSVGLAALASPLAADASKLCKPQVAECSAALAPLVEGNPNAAEQLACCSFLGTCNVTGFFDCLIDIQTPESAARLFR